MDDLYVHQAEPVQVEEAALPSREMFVEWAKKIRSKAHEQGHVLGPFQSTGTGEDVVYYVGCIECLCMAHITPKGYRGVIIDYPCDPNAVDKTIEFPPGSMGEDHRKRISGPWIHPANTASKK